MSFNFLWSIKTAPMAAMTAMMAMANLRAFKPMGVG